MGLTSFKMVKNIAYLFPGQGAQFVGMGKDLHDFYPSCKNIYDKANEILGFNLAKLCFEGPAENLSRTQNSQPAILVTSIACLRAMEESSKDKVKPAFAAGLSLGEYTALYAAGAISFEDAVMLVRKRGLAMEQASQQNPGKMASVIGLSRDQVDDICKTSNTEIANLNCPGQVVISGRKDAIENAASLAKEKGAKKAIILDVSGPFHCSLMEPASAQLKAELDKIQISMPQYPVISNVTAKEEISAEEIKDNLITQLCHSTRWEDSIRYIASNGIKDFLEIGPGKVLKGLIRRIDPTLTVHTIGTLQDIQACPVD
jgi:[acyl-carrier-protein] S-malonyltransferase